VAYGTAQRARIPGATVAGKTGSVRTAAGTSLAWFAGFVPSRAPEVVVAVVLQGYSGGSDAAPVGGRILQAWRAGKL
jgi:cell division protein FtsI/penicillin-binding protein 2